MHTCPRCRGQLIKYGFLKKEKTQRYKCKKCRKLCSDAPNRVFGTLRSKPHTIVMVTKLLTEGVGIRAAGRIANCHRDTVLRILKHAGNRSHELLQKKLTGLKVSHVQADETWTFVQKKADKEMDPEQDKNPWGDFYVFLAMDSESKLLLMPTMGKRTEVNTELLAADLARCTTGRFQLTTDGFRPYKPAMKNALGDRIDFAQIYKERHMTNATKKDKEDYFCVRSGSPDEKRITTAHIERANLTLRLFNRRFNRKTVCFSKDEEYLACSVYLFAAHYNFCWNHSAFGKKTTPAMASGIADRTWNIHELLSKP